MPRCSGDFFDSVSEDLESLGTSDVVTKRMRRTWLSEELGSGVLVVALSCADRRCRKLTQDLRCKVQIACAQPRRQVDPQAAAEYQCELQPPSALQLLSRKENTFSGASCRAPLYHEPTASANSCASVMRATTGRTSMFCRTLKRRVLRHSSCRF